MPMTAVASAAAAENPRPVARVEVEHTDVISARGKPDMAVVDFKVSYSNGKSFECHSRFGILEASAKGASLKLNEGTCHPQKSPKELRNAS